VNKLVLVNALVRRLYTQRGDTFLNLHPDRLEVVNDGPLPLGVIPKNVLYSAVRRNDHLARLFALLRGSRLVAQPQLHGWHNAQAHRTAP
jgi:predicted HTH transcriptional regulator